ncbi:MAG: FMN-binding negative transcriptional regulator [Sporolactobacillus sp.]
MYTPESFKLTDKNRIFNLIDRFPFATIFSQHTGKACATHLPLVLDRKKELLIGHFARPNDQWNDLAQQESLIVFQGPHCYISPTWYETKMAVPTWNYVAVHLYCQAEIIDDPEELRDSLDGLVRKFEDGENNYQMNHVDSDFIQKMFKGIAGVRFKINRIEAKQKLSQNHPEERKKRVIDHLRALGDENSCAIAQLMEENLKSFKKTEGRKEK